MKKLLRLFVHYLGTIGYIGMMVAVAFTFYTWNNEKDARRAAFIQTARFQCQQNNAENAVIGDALRDGYRKLPDSLRGLGFNAQQIRNQQEITRVADNKFLKKLPLADCTVTPPFPVVKQKLIKKPHSS